MLPSGMKASRAAGKERSSVLASGRLVLGLGARETAFYFREVARFEQMCTCTLRSAAVAGASCCAVKRRRDTSRIAIR